MLLENQVALVTGAASGIGRASAQLFAREGAKVVVADIRETKSLATVESIRASGGEAVFVRTDVGKMDEVQRLVQETLSNFGRLDVLYSNAAAYAMGSATAVSETDWDRTLDVCLKATWMLAHHAVPVMLDQGKGVIIVTGSNHAIRGYPDYAAYQAAKGGLLALTRSLAADYAPTIRANAILPGGVITDLWDEPTDEDLALASQTTPLKRIGTPEEIAQVALFFASEMSSYVTGTHLLVDGGFNSMHLIDGHLHDPSARKYL